MARAGMIADGVGGPRPDAKLHSTASWTQDLATTATFGWHYF